MCAFQIQTENVDDFEGSIKLTIKKTYDTGYNNYYSKKTLSRPPRHKPYQERSTPPTPPPPQKKKKKKKHLSL